MNHSLFSLTGDTKYLTATSVLEPNSWKMFQKGQLSPLLWDFPPSFLSFFLIILESEEKRAKSITKKQNFHRLKRINYAQKSTIVTTVLAAVQFKGLFIFYHPLASYSNLLPSNISNILSDIEFVICTYNFLHFLLGFTHCSLSSKVTVENTTICLALFSLLLLFLVISVSRVNKLIPSLGGFLIVFCLCASKSHHIFSFTTSVPYWDSWKYVLTPSIKDDLCKDISTKSAPSFNRRKNISFENPSIGNNHNQFTALWQSWLSENTLQSRNYDSHWPTEGTRHNT